jgi:ABC-type antimicrobial peptide transport system permease subunit
MRTIIFAILGAILGVPLSYFFQPEIVKSKVGGIGGYIQHLDQIVQNESFLTNVIVSVVIFAIVGGIFGYFMDKNAKAIKK